jgi:hypothetical protein
MESLGLGSSGSEQGKLAEYVAIKTKFWFHKMRELIEYLRNGQLLKVPLLHGVNWLVLSLFISFLV